MIPRDWRDTARSLSARLAVVERRSETAAVKALVRLLLEPVNAAPCGCPSHSSPHDRCGLCEAWAALGHAGPWPGAAKAGRVMGR